MHPLDGDNINTAILLVKVALCSEKMDEDKLFIIVIYRNMRPIVCRISLEYVTLYTGKSE